MPDTVTMEEVLDELLRVAAGLDEAAKMVARRHPASAAIFRGSADYAREVEFRARPWMVHPDAGKKPKLRLAGR
jgi:hypothetical protein